MKNDIKSEMTVRLYDLHVLIVNSCLKTGTCMDNLKEMQKLLFSTFGLLFDLKRYPFAKKHKAKGVSQNGIYLPFLPSFYITALINKVIKLDVGSNIAGKLKNVSHADDIVPLAPS